MQTKFPNNPLLKSVACSCAWCEEKDPASSLHEKLQLPTPLSQSNWSWPYTPSAPPVQGNKCCPPIGVIVPIGCPLVNPSTPPPCAWTHFTYSQKANTFETREKIRMMAWENIRENKVGGVQRHTRATNPSACLYEAFQLFANNIPQLHKL